MFVVEPMLAKALLPSLGGSPATWAACVASFQLLLLAAYAYVHLVARRLSRRAQVWTQAAWVLLAAVAAVHTALATSPVVGRPGALGVFAIVLERVGLPYFVLCCTAPLVLRWVEHGKARPVLGLYALSNAGALLGLLTYPFLVEPSLELETQLFAWSGLVVLFALAMVRVFAAVLARPAEETPVVEEPAAERAGAADIARWVVLSFVPSALLVSASNHVTVDVAATPLLWVLPLSVYLLSFVVAFGARRDAFGGVALVLFAAGAVFVGIEGFEQASAPLFRQLGGTMAALFGTALLCHIELSRRRPAGAGLTTYFLAVAVGGAAGGVFVSFAAPFLFKDYYEHELSLLAACVVLGVASFGWSRRSRLALLLVVGLAAPLLIGAIAVRAASAARDGTVVERRRSFLGPLRVVDLPDRRVLTHGRIQHGAQFRAKERRGVLGAYYGPSAGIARVFQALRARRDHPLRIGVVGLGAGTIAGYARAGDSIRFYELDPNVMDVARRHFSFLDDSPAHVEIVTGDGRILLSNEAPQHFDVLVLDAFSSDSVPVHLLTREAFAVYARHLSPGGVLVANASNRYLAVDRVIRASARSIGLSCRTVETPTDRARGESHAVWVIAAPEAFLAAALPDVPPLAAPETLWTDRRASLWSILR